MDTTNHTFVSLDTAALRLGLPVRWFRREVTAGRIPYVQAGRRKLFDVEAVRSALLNQADTRDGPTITGDESVNADFLNLHGLARELQLPADWLKAESGAGRIPYLAIRGRLRFSLSAVRAALASRAAKGEGTTNGE